MLDLDQHLLDFQATVLKCSQDVATAREASATKVAAQVPAKLDRTKFDEETAHMDEGRKQAEYMRQMAELASGGMEAFFLPPKKVVVEEEQPSPMDIYSTEGGTKRGAEA